VARRQSAEIRSAPVATDGEKVKMALSVSVAARQRIGEGPNTRRRIPDRIHRAAGPVNGTALEGNGRGVSPRADGVRASHSKKAKQKAPGFNKRKPRAPDAHWARQTWSTRAPARHGKTYRFRTFVTHVTSTRKTVGHPYWLCVSMVYRVSALVRLLQLRLWMTEVL